jgi:hypothetical protein
MGTCADAGGRQLTGYRLRHRPLKSLDYFHFSITNPGIVPGTRTGLPRTCVDTLTQSSASLSRSFLLVDYAARRLDLPLKQGDAGFEFVFAQALDHAALGHFDLLWHQSGDDL